MAILAIEAGTRKKSGKGVARRLRADGRVPAIMYGASVGPELLELDEREITHLIGRGAEGRLVSLDIAGEKRSVILKEVQRDPVRGSVIHVDFHAVALDKTIQTPVTVIIVGESERESTVKVDEDGIQIEGILVHGVRELTVECLPTDIPEYLEADVSKLEVGDTIRAEDLDVPEGVTLVDDPDTVIVSVVIPRIEEVEGDEEELEEPILIGGTDDEEVEGEEEEETGEHEDDGE